MLKRTPLYSAHIARGAKMVAFGGWEMPVQYSGILDEHAAVRQRAGLFDISHMGELRVAGPDAATALNRLLTNDVRKLAVGQGQYTLLCNDAGGIRDDLILYRTAANEFLLVVNAANIEKDFTWLRAHGAAPEDLSEQMAAVALQGPAVIDVLSAANQIPPFHVARQPVAGRPCWVARTGYTGEDGFEILCDATDAEVIWSLLLNAGALPCGLGARDTLRLEACLPLHGHEIADDTTPIEAGLSRFVAFDKGDFTGRAVLAGQREKGVARKLVAFKMAAAEKGPPPRSHYAILAGGRKIGDVTSGTQSPTLGCGIGMGYVEAALAEVGTKIEIEVRGRSYPAVIANKPLYKRGQ